MDIRGLLLKRSEDDGVDELFNLRSVRRHIGDV